MFIKVFQICNEKQEGHDIIINIDSIDLIIPDQISKEYIGKGCTIFTRDSHCIKVKHIFEEIVNRLDCSDYDRR